MRASAWPLSISAPKAAYGKCSHTLISPEDTDRSKLGTLTPKRQTAPHTTMNEQLIDLQTRLAFQEDNIGEINRTLAAQANEIRELRLEIDALKRQVRTLTPSNIASESEETPPPHY